jgi:hypothetical protein
MCQIIAGPSAKVKSTLLSNPRLLKELFDNNGDGWGAMYHTTSGTKAIKKLPRTVECTREYIQALPQDDRQVALHWRMRTSGHIDTHNAHPHFVEGGWLIHNGVLSAVDLSSDPTKCDTIHFSRQYLDGNVEAIIRSERMRNLIGEFIGNNRFVLLSDDGQMCIINKQQGYEVDGIWVANTYASSRRLIDPSYKPTVYLGNKSYVGYKGYGWHLQANAWAFGLDDDRDDEYQMYGSAGAGAGSARASAEVFEQEDERDEADDVWAYVEETVDMALYQFDTTALGDLIEEFPFETLTYIFTFYEVSEYSRFDPSEWDLAHAAATAAWVDGDTEALLRINEHVVAEAIIQCCDWDLKPHAETPADKPTLSLVQ